jgi:hypothetical protein
MKTAQAVWVDHLRAKLEEMLASPGRYPTYGEVLRSGADALAGLDRDFDALTDLVDRGRFELDDPHSLTRATAEDLAGAVYGLISMRLIRGDDGDDLSSLLPQLMFVLTRPYLGRDAAFEEFHRAG